MEFICRMKDYLPRTIFIDETIKAVGSHFSVRPVQLDTIETPANVKFEPSTRLLINEELESVASTSQLEVSLSQLM